MAGSRPDVHPRFADPAADITLSSSDRVIFYVHSYHLQAASLLFRETFADPALRLSPVPILIDHPSALLAAFLDLATGTTPVLSILDAHALAGVLDKYRCAPLRARLAHALLALRRAHPWEVFCVASALGEEETARVAVAAMSREAYWDDRTRARPADAYLAALRRATAAVGTLHCVSSCEYGSRRAAAFELAGNNDGQVGAGTEKRAGIDADVPGAGKGNAGDAPDDGLEDDDMANMGWTRDGGWWDKTTSSAKRPRSSP